MSMFGQGGSQLAAQDILHFVAEKLEEYHDKPDAIKALKEVQVKVQEIENAAKLGTY